MRAVPATLRAVAAKSVGVDPDSSSMGFRALPKKDKLPAEVAAVLSEISSIQSSAMGWFKNVTYPVANSSNRIVSIKNFKDLRDKTLARASELAAACRRLDAHMGTIRSVARDTLGEAYRDDLYTRKFEEVFTIELDVINMDVPFNLRNISEDIYKEYFEEVKKNAAETVKGIEDSLGSALVASVSSMINSLKAEMDGSSKGRKSGISTPNLTKLMNVLDKFGELGVSSVGGLKAAVDGLKVKVNEIIPDDINREEIADLAAGLRKTPASAASQMVSNLQPVLDELKSSLLVRGVAAVYLGD
jgi:hypothetical protein